MQYRYIGKSGLRVSSISLGTMTFGSFTAKKEAFLIMDKAYDNGVNFFDTAELYPVPPDSKYTGETEKIVGEWIKTKKRDSIILASKVAGASSGWFVPPIRHGLTAIDSFHIQKAIEGSLRRLNTDYIDLYQMHWPDSIVPIEESLKAFDRLIKSGKVRYIGTSNDTAYNLTKANEISKYNNLARFESIQNNFSLLNPRFLDSLAQVCKKENISLLPYSPLAGGVLSGKYNLNPNDKSARFFQYLQNDNPRIRAQAKKFLNDKTLKATQKYLELAKEYNIPITSMAIAWSLRFDFVASTIIGVTKLSQLNELLDGSKITLDNKIITKIKQIQQEIMYPMG